MRNAEVVEASERLRRRCEELWARAMAGELDSVAREIGGIDLTVDEDEEARNALLHPLLRYDPYPRRLLEAICQRVIPDAWDYRVEATLTGKPVLTLLCYTQRYIGSRL